LRWRQGQTLRVLRNLDTAGRGRSIDRAGSEGMPLPYLTTGISRLAAAPGHLSQFRRQGRRILIFGSTTFSLRGALDQFECDKTPSYFVNNLFTGN